MRTTIEIKPEQRAELLKLAAQRGDKGFSTLVQEALDLYLRRHREKREAALRALKLQGSLTDGDAEAMSRSIAALREVAVIVADSDVLIDFLRGKGEGAARVAHELSTSDLATTAITAFELRSGAHSAKQKRAVETLLAAMTILPFGAEEAALASELRQRLERAGSPIGMADYLIAATCVASGSSLLTRNRKHFERIAELSLRPI